MKLVLTLALLTLFLPCAAQSQKHSDIHLFLDQWHKAAANADSTIFFGSMADDAIYIGTDATERWTKTEFMAFAKPYFARGKAWDFKPYDRDLHVTSDGKNAWFSELLTTWMGVCRGSGVLRKTKKGWKIEQYHLSVTVPNDIIKDFITLVDSYQNRKSN
ncbi:MAG TPA: nuclear transport factor 2 family protein [Ohtaekwangia sp.]